MKFTFDYFREETEPERKIREYLKGMYLIDNIAFDATDKITKLITDDIKEQKSNRTDFYGVYYKTGELQYKENDVEITVKYHHYNFFNRLRYEEYHDKLPIINTNNGTDTIEITLFAMSGHITFSTVNNIVYNEIRKLYCLKYITEHNKSEYINNTELDINSELLKHVVDKCFFDTFDSVFVSHQFSMIEYNFFNLYKDYYYFDKVFINSFSSYDIDELELYYKVITDMAYKNEIENIISSSYIDLTLNELIDRVEKSIQKRKNKIGEILLKEIDCISENYEERLIENKVIYSTEDIEETKSLIRKKLNLDND